jgi:hypothetical protein
MNINMSEVVPAFMEPLQEGKCNCSTCKENCVCDCKDGCKECSCTGNTPISDQNLAEPVNVVCAPDGTYRPVPEKGSFVRDNIKE